ncbi:MAG: TIM barrel protein [Burkholderiaceae bacterium]
MATTIRFAINRICAAHWPLPAFAAMVQRLGVDTIELRNDLAGVEMLDGTPPAEIAAVASAHGLTIRSINALQRFDQFDAARAQEAADLLQFAGACGAQAIVLCPTNSRDDRRSANQRHDQLVHALSCLLPMLRENGVNGLIEPLGFAECAVRCKSQALRAMQALGSPAELGLLHDSFHHHLAGDDTLFPAATRLVHISGVDDPAVSVAAMRDSDRGLIGPQDRLGNVRQLRALLDAGYDGVVSFEPFADAIITATDIEQQLARSMDYLSAAVAASTGTEVNSVR